MKRQRANVKRETADVKGKKNIPPGPPSKGGDEMVRVVLDPAVRTMGTMRVNVAGRIYTLTHKVPVEMPKADLDTMRKWTLSVAEYNPATESAG